MADEESQPNGIQPTRSQPTGSQPTGTELAKESIISRFRKGVFKKTTGPLGLLADNQTTLKNLIVAAVTVGLEILLSKELFNCPLEGHALYGWVFIFAPTPILFCANVLIIGQMWKLSTRCYFTRYQRRGDVFARLIPNIFKALVGPCVWLVASFADTAYFVCATVGPDAVKRNLTIAANITALKKEMDAAQSASHLWAWLVFIIVVFACTVVIVTMKCCLKDNELLDNPYEFERREALQALITFEKFIKGSVEKKNQDEEEGAATETAPPAEGSSNENENDDECAEYTLKGDNENVKLYCNGIPELTGKKEVEEMFVGWLNKDKTWCYTTAHEIFSAKYPRAATGDPRDPWKSFQPVEIIQPAIRAPSPSPRGSVSIPMDDLGSGHRTDDSQPHEGAALLPS